MSRIKKWGAAAGALSLIAVATAAYLYPNNIQRLVSDDAGDTATSAANTTKGRDNSASAAGAGADGEASKFAGINLAHKRATYIVVFKDPALASYKGTMPGLPQPERSRDEQGTMRLDSDGDNSERYVDYLQQRQAQMETRMSTMAGRDVSPRHTMQHALNGMVVDLSEAEVRSIRLMTDVRLVEPYREYDLLTDSGPSLIGAPAVWTGTNPGAPGPYRGEGVVVGILDTGINFGSPSFSAVGPIDGYTHINPLGAGTYLGTCAPGGDDDGRCNDKLIGGHDFVCGAPVNACTNGALREEPGFGDTNSHGSHVASTSAGNVRDVSVSGNTIRVSGVAPHANIIAYDVCYTNIATGQGSCPNVSTAAAVDQAVADGVVDAINFSIGGGIDPWGDATSLAFLNAMDAGIFVAAAAGNSGPGANTMGHNQPWVSTTAASKHGRAGFGIAMSVTGPAPVPANLAPIIVNQGSGGVALSATIPGTTPMIISPGISTTTDGCAAFPANVFASAIAVIRRGGCPFSTKVNNATLAGAVVVVIANNQPSVILPSVPGTTIPVLSVTQIEGDNLRNFGQANPTTTTAQVTFPAIPLPNTADALAAFSSRGPAGGALNIMKPDITAPGVDILAAIAGTTLTGFENAAGLMSGTSMASPHQAGAAALIRQARPNWTPPEIKSALAMTAVQTVYMEDDVTLANPLARGSGRVQVDRAINAGLVLNETLANYQAADPEIGGDPSTLNQPNLYNRSCYPTCVFYRTFRNPTATTSSWRVQLQGVSGTVTPMITVPANGTLRVKFTVYGFSLPANGTLSYGNVVMTPATGSAPVLRMPVGVAVQPPAASLPASASLSLAANATGSVYFPIRNTGGSNLTYSFVNSGTAIADLINSLSGAQGNGYASTRYTDSATAGSQAQFASDDFQVAQPTLITRIHVDGFTLVSASLGSVSPNLTWSIYPDAAGLPAGDPITNPGAAVWTYTAGATSAGVSAVTTSSSDSITLNLTTAGQVLNLPAGRYWLVVNTNSTLANRWHWFVSSQTSGNAGVAAMIVPTTGPATWQVVTLSGVDPVNGFAMQITGSVPCGAPWISGTYAASGTLSRGASAQAMTVVYGTGLAAGNYSGNVCVQSNDPVNPRIAMPVNLTVTP